MALLARSLDLTVDIDLIGSGKILQIGIADQPVEMITGRRPPGIAQARLNIAAIPERTLVAL